MSAECEAIAPYPRLSPDQHSRPEASSDSDDAAEPGSRPSGKSATVDIRDFFCAEAIPGRCDFARAHRLARESR